MKYICENCGEEITANEYFATSMWKDALCSTCKKLSKKKREQRAYEMFMKREKENANV